jgi:hypothetical protein
VKLTAVLTLCASTALVGACGGARGIEPRGAQLLDAQVAAARDAARGGDYARATTLLHAVDDSVQHLRARELISDRRAIEILVALGDTQDALRGYVATSKRTTTTTTTAPRPVQPAPTSTPAPTDRVHNKRDKGDKHSGDNGD